MVRCRCLPLYSGTVPAAAPGLPAPSEPRACPVKHSSATNRLIEAKDKASVQLNIGHVNGACTDACYGQRSLASARRSQRLALALSQTNLLSLFDVTRPGPPR